jgi:ParB/RepB/Spo0J family partition protein
MPETKTIALSGIAVAKHRLRALRESNVNALVRSMADQGQLQPVVVRPHKGGGYCLVAGLHRFEAAKKLKWKKIRCTVFDDMDADQAELAEIDENLIRADLTPAEEAAHIGKRKELNEKLHPETKHGAVGRRGKRSQNATSFEPAEAFIDDTAKKTGKHRATVARKAARAKVIVVTDVIGTSLDSGVELDALAKLPIEKQRSLAAAAKRGENVSAKSTPLDYNSGVPTYWAEEVELRKGIARLRRDQPQNADAMLICDALERRLKMVTFHPDQGRVDGEIAAADEPAGPRGECGHS